MARLPTAADISGRTPRSVRGVPNYGSNPIGAALQNLGQATAQFGLQELAKSGAEAEKREAFGVQSRYLAFENNWNKQYADRAEAVQPGAAGFADTFNKDFLASADELSATIPDALKPEYYGRMQRFQGRLGEATKGFEREEYDRFAKVKIKEGQQTLLQRQALNPSDWQKDLQEGEEHIRNSGLNPVETDREVRAWRASRAKAYLDNVQATDPARAQALLGFAPASMRSVDLPADVYGRAARARDRLVQVHGLTQTQASGLVGRWVQESGVRSDGPAGDTEIPGGSQGIGQWNRERLAALQAFAAKKNLPWRDFDAQVDFAAHELNTTEKKYGDRLRASTTVEDATAAAMGFERPRGWTDANPKGGHGWSNSLAAAQRIAGQPVTAGSEIAEPVEVDPAVADIPYEDRRQLYDQSVALELRAQQAAAQQAAAQLTTDIAATKGAYQLGIETEEVVDRGVILNNPILPDDDKAQLLKALDTKLEQTSLLRADQAAYVAGGSLDLNPLDSADKARAGKLYDSIIKHVPEEQAAVVTGDFIDRTGVVPPSVAANVRRGIESEDPAQAAQSLADAANIYERAPTAIDHMDGGGDIRDAAATFTHLTDDRGYSSADAAKRMIAMRTPEAKRTEAAMKPAADKFEKTLTIGEITGLFDPSFIPGFGGDPEAGFNPVLSELALADYREIAREKYVGEARGDAGIAKAMAQKEMQALYGVTEINGSPTLMKYPPEKFYPPIDGGWDYLRTAAMFDAELAEGQSGFVKDIYLETTPDTVDDIRAGRLPRYRFYYATEENGQAVWNEVFKDGQRQGFGFTPQQLKGVQDISRNVDSAGSAIERDIHRSIAEDVTTQTDALKRGGLPDLEADRERLMRERAQQERDDQYMRRGDEGPLIRPDEQPKESPTLKFLGGITAPLRENE